MEMNVNRPPFDDVRVRQALNYAVDKQLIMDELYGGRAVALPGPLSPFNNFANKDLKPYPYDPDKALALLEEAGWTDSDGDGMLDKDGETFAFTIDTTELQRTLTEAVAGQFRALGIDAGVRSLGVQCGEAETARWGADGLPGRRGATRPLIQSATSRPSGTAAWKGRPTVAETSRPTATSE